MPDNIPDGPSQLLRRVLSTTAAVGLLAAGAIALAGAASATASTVYVDPDGSNHDGCGTSMANQCQTIQYGIGQASPGATVQVAAGTYQESLSITKGITLQGAGIGSSIIDGTGSGPLTDGLVAIGTTDGDVTITGFTVENAPASTNGTPFAISIINSNPDVSVAISHNKILGTPEDPDYYTDGPVGIDSGDTYADVTVANNDISGVWQGVLVEGSRGAVAVKDNHLHHLITGTDTDPDPDTVYPAEGVYILSDKANAESDQDVVDNTFDGYGGIGIAFSAGYNLGGCTDSSCNGSASGSITGNTFQLMANPGTVAASAIRLRAVNAGNDLNVTMGGNTGTVAADTKTVEETPNAGTISITPGDTPNTIIPTPTPTLAVPAPATLTAGAAAADFTGTATNPEGGDAIAHARYDVAITGTSGITHDQVTLEYEVAPGSWESVPLSGTTAGDGSITGYFGPLGGFPFAADDSVHATPFRLSVPSSAPGGVLHTSISLDEVSTGSGNPVLNTVASTSNDTTVVSPTTLTEEITPHPLTSANTPVVNVAVHTNGDTSGGTVHIDATSFHLSGPVSNGHAAITLPRIVSGTHYLTVSYTGTSTTASYSHVIPITVVKAPVTLGYAFSPVHPTSANTTKVTVTVNAGGAATTGATVSIKATSFTVSAKVASNGKAVITLPKINGGSHPLTIVYAGNGATLAVNKSITITVTKVGSSMSYTTSPPSIKSTTTNAKMTVTVKATGASVNGGTVTLSGASKYGTAKVVNGKATITLPKANKGAHTWKLTYSGTASAAASTKIITVTIH